MIVHRLALRRHDGVFPLHPAAAVHERAVLLNPVRHRKLEDFGWYARGFDAGPVPKLRTRRRERIHHDEPLEIRKRLQHLIAVGADARRGHPREHHAFHSAAQRFVVDREPRRVPARLGKIRVREIVGGGRAIAVPRAQHAHQELFVIGSEEIPGARIELLGGVFLNVTIDRFVAGHRNGEIAGENIPRNRIIRVALNVCMPAFGVHAAAGPPHVAEEQLQHRSRSNELRTGRMMRQPDGIDDRHDFVGPPISPTISAIFKKSSCGMPVIAETISGV